MLENHQLGPGIHSKSLPQKQKREGKEEKKRRRREIGKPRKRKEESLRKQPEEGCGVS